MLFFLFSSIFLSLSDPLITVVSVVTDCTLHMLQVDRVGFYLERFFKSGDEHNARLRDFRLLIVKN